MKIAVLRRRYSGYGGGERFVDTFLRVLAEAGHDVHLFSHAWPAPVPRVTVHRVPTLAGATLGLVSYAVLAPRLARAAGVRLIHSFERTLEQDLYRAGEGCHRQWLALRRRHLRGGLGGLDRVRPFHLAVLAIERRVCRGGAARRMAVNSRLVEAGFVRHYGPLRVEMTLLRNGVDVVRFHPDVRAGLRPAGRRDLGLGEGQVTLVTVGSGFSRKGLATTMRALGTLKRQAGARPILVVVGRGHPQSFRRLAGREGVDDQVRFLDPVCDPRPLYAAADVFVLPTVYDPSSNATLEALAMGLPVITTTTNGSGELIAHGRSGWLLASPDDHAGLAGILAEGLDPVRRRAIGEEGRAVVATYTWERHLDETLALYRRLAP